MEKILIKADTRAEKGKSTARRLRKEGRIPAVLYGREVDPLSISVSLKDWEKLGKQLKRNVILNMEVHGLKKKAEHRPVMIKHVQTGVLKNEILHIDFLQVSMERTIEVEIPIHLVGRSKGEANDGIVDQHLRSIKVECLPTQIPEKIEVDISDLDIGDSYHVNQISIPGIKLLEHLDVAVVTVIPPTVEEKPVVAEEVAPAAVEPEKKEKEKEKEE
ncbi:MAG: 50S ribosomal protein L25 [Syntrophorhabdaceae bacterium]|jgi:large subunit ribosomal protein L25|nr:50S ribosomal protein L25 [Syntrophorhabdaceae bacterium]MDD5245013.1 50S ribosomal protein L25 [Syntrophorhabdaceae bacterium]